MVGFGGYFQCGLANCLGHFGSWVSLMDRCCGGVGDDLCGEVGVAVVVRFGGYSSPEFIF